MNRLSYALGAGYITLCAAAVVRAGQPVVATDHPAAGARSHGTELLTPERPLDGAPTWFATIKPNCNSLEVETAMQRLPAPAGLEGAGYEAACFALAGKIDRARAVIERLDQDGRWRAAGIVFDVAHPVADQGDDRSAGPIMAMVVDYWPNHYMALYHAGMSESALGDEAKARRHLESFLRLYHENDGWQSSARTALERLQR